MPLPERMTFGVFLGPFHRVGENPTLAIDRDLELVQWLDHLGYDEAWIGEHHSAGWEIIASPEIFMAVAADRTKHIKLGSGVISLPYHHPLMVADRMVQLDHMTHGRVMLGVGPGALPGDAYMMGIPPEVQRARMDESLGVIIRLFTEDEPVTYKCDWFELNEGLLQLRPYQKPHMPIAVASVQTGAGVTLAGKHGAAVLTITVPRDPSAGPADLKGLWAVAEESAAEHGHTMNRDDWRLVLPVHLAETRKEALEDARIGSGRYLRRYSTGPWKKSSTRWRTTVRGSSGRPTTASKPFTGWKNRAAALAGSWSRPWTGRPGKRCCAATNFWPATSCPNSRAPW